MVESYIKILNMLNVNVINETLFTLSGDEIKYGGYIIKVPTTDAVKYSMSIDKNGISKTNYLLFNPYYETITVGNSYNPIKIIQQRIKTVLSVQYPIVVKNILSIIFQPKLQDKIASPNLLKFLNNTKVEVSKQTIDHYTKLLEASKNDIHINTVKKVDGKKILREAIITSQILDDLNELPDDDWVELYGVKLRRKEVNAYKEVIRWVLNFNEKDCYITISNNEYTPILNSMLEAYYDLTSSINELIEATKTVEDLTSFITDLSIEKEELLEYSTTFRKIAITIGLPNSNAEDETEIVRETNVIESNTTNNVTAPQGTGVLSSLLGVSENSNNNTNVADYDYYDNIRTPREARKKSLTELLEETEDNTSSYSIRTPSFDITRSRTMSFHSDGARTSINNGTGVASLHGSVNRGRFGGDYSTYTRYNSNTYNRRFEDDRSFRNRANAYYDNSPYGNYRRRMF